MADATPIPGSLTGVEWYKSGKLDFDDTEKAVLKGLVTKINARDMASRREQIILVWKKRLYCRNLQHILPIFGGGWQLPPIGSGYNPNDQQSQAMFTVNIYTPYGDIIASALTREVPTTRFEPGDPNDDVDITAAEGAEKIKLRIQRDNDLKSRMEDMARLLWTDGQTIFFSTYQRDGQRFGYESDEPEAVPEDEEEISASEKSDQAVSESGEGAGEELEAGGDEESEPETDKQPRGHEVIICEGALEWKLPMKAQCLAECSYARRAKEIDLQIARAKYPDVASQIQPATGGPGGDDIDRLARINVQLGVMDSYNTMDSEVFDVTEEKIFLRPAALLELPEGAARDSLMKKAGNKGLYLTYCGETLCEGWARSMDQHISLVHGRAGDGMNRPGLGDWLVPIQEVLNTWMELAHDYFVRGVPAKWMDNEMFNVEAMKDQVNQVGEVHPFDREPGVTMEESIFEETPPVFPAQLQAFIEDFKGDLAQLLSGAFPALYGGDMENEGVGDAFLQRDQALGRIGLPWRRIKDCLANVFCQVVRLLAENHEDAIQLAGGEAVTVEIEELKGNFYAFPETDENFPESYTEIQNRLTKLWTDATTNPTVAEFVYNPSNLELFLRYGLATEEFYLPQVESADTQLGEATLLLKAEPVPNPDLADGQKQLLALRAKEMQVGQAGQVAPQLSQMIQGLQQKLSTLPPEVSSVPIDAECDDHDTHAAVCFKLMYSTRCRELKHGTPEDQAAFKNLRLHYLEHVQAGAAKKAQQKPTGKPPSVSIALKDLPPREAAEAATMAGIPADAKDFEAEEVAEAASKHPGPGGIT